MKPRGILLLATACIGLAAAASHADLDVQILNQQYSASISINSADGDPSGHYPSSINCAAGYSGPPPFYVWSGTKRDWVSAAASPFGAEMTYHMEDPIRMMTLSSEIETTFRPLYPMPVEITAHNQIGPEMREVCLRDTSITNPIDSVIAGALPGGPPGWIDQAQVILQPDHIYSIHVYTLGIWYDYGPDGNLHPINSCVPVERCEKTGFDICEVPTPGAVVLGLVGLLSCVGMKLRGTTA